MRTSIPTTVTLFVILLATPSIASAEPVSALAAASNGPWIALAIIGMVRAALCLGNRSRLDDEDPNF